MIKFINCGLLNCSKLELLERGLEKLPFDILGLAEVGRKSLDLLKNKTGWVTSEKATFRSGGVALYTGKRLIDNVIETRTTDDRSLTVKFKTQTGNLLLIVVYAPHEGYQVSNYISFLTGLENQISPRSRRRNTILLGDFNAKISRNSSQSRGYGLHHRESRNGQYLLRFCQKHDLLIANSLFPTEKGSQEATEPILTEQVLKALK